MYHNSYGGCYYCVLDVSMGCETVLAITNRSLIFSNSTGNGIPAKTSLTNRIDTNAILLFLVHVKKGCYTVDVNPRQDVSRHLVRKENPSAALKRNIFINSEAISLSFLISGITSACLTSFLVPMKGDLEHFFNLHFSSVAESADAAAIMK